MDHLVHRIVRCTAATIAGRKPATLMNLSNANGGLLDTWDLCKAGIFTGSEIEYYELKRTERNAVVLFFSRNRLNKVLKKQSVKRFLQGCGYESGSIEFVLEVLSQRYAASGCPPEIGIFLGIPLKDVMGFIGLSSLENTKCGMWRVYIRHRLSPPFAPETVSVDMRIKRMTRININKSFERCFDFTVAQYEFKLVTGVFCEDRAPAQLRVPHHLSCRVLATHY